MNFSWCKVEDAESNGRLIVQLFIAEHAKCSDISSQHARNYKITVWVIEFQTLWLFLIENNNTIYNIPLTDIDIDAAFIINLYRIKSCATFAKLKCNKITKARTIDQVKQMII